MKTIYIDSQNLAFWQTKSIPNVMALGFFDGIHLGHKKVIETARTIAQEKNITLTVMTFFPHPKTVLTKNVETFDYLMPLSKKLSILQSLGVDTCYIVEFDKKFCSLSPKQFVSNYLIDMNVLHAVAGFDFTYGHKGAGNIDRLKTDAFNKIAVTKVEKLDYFGTKVSSTWIRELLLQGEIQLLSHILGRFYETEVYWNGEYFQLLPYYTLPAEGVYRIAIQGKKFVMK